MSKSSPETAKSKIAAWVKNYSGRTATEISKAMGISPSAVHTSLSRLVGEGALKRFPVGDRIEYYPGDAKCARPVVPDFGVSPGMKLLNDCLAGVRNVH
ncbi:winged helix-turn-helix transcriptional regulator [Klebsiella sp. Ap-873]|nr:winged helix-turn-helix transcriptional regulator [Klebsiella sp. Ap-873]